MLKEEIEQVGTLDDYLAKVESGEICPSPWCFGPMQETAWRCG